MDADSWWVNFGQRKAKLTALQKLVTHNEKVAGKCKKNVAVCEKLKPKLKKSVATTSVTILSAQMKVLKNNRRHHLGIKHSSVRGQNNVPMGKEVAAPSLPSETEVAETAQLSHPRCVLFRPSDIPPLSQLNNFVTRSAIISRRDEAISDHEWAEGQMLWGKIGSYPFWPCMVSRDPFSKQFTKKVGSNKTSRAFHVQFFGGNAERSWINTASLLEYEGRDKFVDIIQYGLRNPESCSRSPDEFKVSPDWFPSWSLAVAQAEAGFKLGLDARIQRYTFQYVLVKGKAQKPVEELLKMVASKSSRDHPQTENDNSDRDDDNVTDYYNEVFSTRNERPLYDSDEFYSSDESSSTCREKPGKLPVKITVRKGLLGVFLAKHTPFVQIEHPDWKKSWIIEYLTHEWSLMSEQQKSRYTTRHLKHGYVTEKKV